MSGDKCHGRVHLTAAGHLFHSDASGTPCRDCAPEDCPTCAPIATELWANATPETRTLCSLAGMIDEVRAQPENPKDVQSWVDWVDRAGGKWGTAEDIAALTDDDTCTRSMQVPAVMNKRALDSYARNAPEMPYTPPRPQLPGPDFRREDYRPNEPTHHIYPMLGALLIVFSGVAVLFGVVLAVAWMRGAL